VPDATQIWSANNYFTYKPQKLSSFLYKNDTLIHIEGKVKVNSRTGHEGPDGEQMYSSTILSTSALDGGWWSTPRPDRFTHGKDPIPNAQEA
jgi:hypothetical protein